MEYYLCDFTLPSLSLLPLLIHSSLSLALTARVALQPVLLSLCLTGRTGNGLDLCDVKATQATAATNKHKGLTAGQPPERGVCLCLCKYLLTVHDRVERSV
ncbi:hypothetical protein ILYODFUR_010467 [Ilyodon furcidens]|uniref:Secreted protein n=1 Tax=Ilyodon furcidens TaxID=33524 RepID=A0ABV0TIR6_9TELE